MIGYFRIETIDLFTVLSSFHGILGLTEHNHYLFHAREEVYLILIEGFCLVCGQLQQQKTEILFWSNSGSTVAQN